MVTIKDVAEAAGVSTATVSRVLSGKNHVRSELRKRVREAARELNYEPGRVARSLRKQSALTFGLVIPDVTNPFFGRLARGVEDAASDHNYSTILCNTDASADKEARYLQVLMAERVSGVVLAPGDEPAIDLLTRLHETGIPVVTVGREISELPIDALVIDYYDAAYQAVSYLQKQGHQRIALLNSLDSDGQRQEAVNGYQAALKQGHFISRSHFQPILDGTFLEDTALVRELIELPVEERPTALIAAGRRALSCLRQATYESNLPVGDGVACVALDYSQGSSLPHVPVVRFPAYELGRLAVTRMLERDRTAALPTATTRLKPELAYPEAHNGDAVAA